jgi:hypothetical protein
LRLIFGVRQQLGSKQQHGGLDIMSFVDSIKKSFFVRNSNRKTLSADTRSRASLVSFSATTTDDSLNRYLDFVRVMQAHNFQARQNMDFSEKSDNQLSWRFSYPTSGYVICIRKLLGTR